MAGETKVFKSIQQGLQELNEAGKLDDLSAKTGIDSEKLTELAEQGTKSKQGKQFLGSILEKLGGKIESVQTEFDILLGRKRDVGGGATPPAVQPAFATEVTGPLTQGAGKGFTTAPSQGPIGGPLVPQQSRLARVGETLDRVTGAPMSSETGLVPYSPRMERPVATAAEVSAAAAQAKPGQAGAGVSELTPGAKIARGEESRMQAERAADFGLNLDLGITPSPKAVKAGLGITAGGAAAYGGYRLLDRTKLAPQDAEKLSVVNASGVDSPESLEQVTAQAEQQGALKPEQGQVIKDQVQQVKEVKETLEQMFARTEKKFEADKARLELFQAIDTIANGLASAIGSAALLNRGSPYAVDFSKGPQVNWDAQFDRLSKDFNSKIGIIKEKYKIEERRKEQEELRGYRQAKLGLEAQKLEADKAKEAAAVETKTAAGREELTNKVLGTLEKMSAPDITQAALSTQAAKLTTDGRKLLGDAVYKQVLADAAKIAEEDVGRFEKAVKAAKEFVGLPASPEDKKQYVRRINALRDAMSKRLSGESAAPAMVTVEVDGQVGQIPADQVENFKKQYPNAIVK